MKRTWIRLFIDQTLKGSMIEELTPEQRWIFIGLLLLAGDSTHPGLIFKRKDEDGNLIGKSEAGLADVLGVDESSIKPAIDKMVQKGKVAVDERGVISICNWAKYQSEYMRQKPYRESDKEPCNESYKPPCNSGYVADREGEGDRDREKKSIVDREPADDLPSRAADMVSKWNRFAEGHGLPKVKGLDRGSSRERAAYARLREKGFDWEEVLKAVHEQDFLQGDNDRGWMATFDWLLKPANLVKVLERAYVKEVRGRARDRAPEDPGVGGRGRR